jgi:hypothetical protein
MATQLDQQLGIKKQDDWDTPATVDQFVEVLPGESLDRDVTFSQSKGLRKGSRVARADRRFALRDGASGTIPLEATVKGLGVWLEAAFGAVTNTEVPTGTGAYQQVHTPATTDPVDVYTIQKGIPYLEDTAASPLTFHSGWCTSIAFSTTAGELLSIEEEWQFKEVVSTTALATASYPAAQGFFSFCDAAIVLGGTLTKPTTTALATSTADAAANVKDFNLRFSNGLSEGRRNLGDGCKPGAPGRLGVAPISGTMTIEYSDNTLRDAYLAQTDLALLLTFTSATLAGTATAAVLQIVVPVINLDGALPKTSADVPISTSVAFTGLDGLASSTEPIYVVYRTSDTTP